MKSIKSKVGLILLGVFILSVVANHAIHKWIISASFLELERDEAQKDLDRSIEAIKREVYHLDSLCHDWAAWDDTCEFIASPSGDYIAANLAEDTFLDNNINLIYIVDLHGSVLWSGMLNLDTRQEIHLAVFPKDTFPEGHPLISYDTVKGPLSDQGISGVFMTEQGPMLMASRPILTTNNEGPIRGSVIFGRFLNDGAIKRLAAQTRVSFRVFAIQGPPQSKTIEKIAANLTIDTPYLFEIKDDSNLLAYTAYPDLKGAAALLIEAAIPRKIYSKGRKAIHYALLSIFLSTFVMLAVILLFLQRAVIQPISDLKKHTLSIGKSGDLSVRLSLRRPDEIGTLADEFDKMLEVLEQKSNDLMTANQQLYREIDERKRAEEAVLQSNARMRTILDLMPIGVAVIDMESREIIDVNPKAVLTTGLPKEKIVGSKCYDIFRSSHKGKCPIIDLGMPTDASEEQILSVNGTDIPIHKVAIPITMDGQKCLVEFFFDITDQKRAEYERLEKEKLNGVIEMAGAVCHELNQPLQGASGYSELLMMDIKEGDQFFQIICRIKGEIDKMGEITKKLMNVTKYKTKDYLKGKIIDIDKASLEPDNHS